MIRAFAVLPMLLASAPAWAIGVGSTAGIGVDSWFTGGFGDLGFFDGGFAPTLDLHANPVHVQIHVLEFTEALIDDEEIYAWDDPIPLTGGHIGLTGSSDGLRFRSLQVASRGTSAVVSCLAVPDAFYNRRLFEEELPGALDRLRHDPSPVAQARASVTYNLIVEGVLAETGYRAYHAMLERNDIMPGMLEVVDRLKTDESRHIAYGVHLLTRLVGEHGEPVWDAIQVRMAELLPLAIGVISEIFEAYEKMAFGLELAEFTDFATAQFESRFKRIERAVAG